MGVPENRGPRYSTINSRILIIKTPPNKVPLFSETPKSNSQRMLMESPGSSSGRLKEAVEMTVVPAGTVQSIFAHRPWEDSG